MDLSRFLVLEALAALPLAIALPLLAVKLAARESDRDLRAALAAREARIEQLERELDELRTLNRDLQRKLSSLERECSERLKRELERVEREYEARLREAQRVSRVALTVLEALQREVLRLVDSRGECKSVIVEPGRVLCRVNDRTVKIIYPEEREAGEDILIQG